MIHHNPDLYYEIYNVINEHNWRQTHNLSLTDFLRLFLMSFKYDLILLRYSLTDSVLFLSPLLSYST